MRLRALMLLGVLAAGAACGDSVGPPPGSGAGRDLEFTAPGFPATARATSYRAGEAPLSSADSAEFVSREGIAAEELQAPLISRAYATIEWMGSRLVLRYGLLGAGTGYTLAPAVRLTESDGTLLREFAGVGRSADSQVYSTLTPAVEETYETGRECGVSADLRARFDVRVDLPGLWPTVMGTSRSVSSQAHQPACRIDGGGSGTKVGGGVTITVCSYEAWVTTTGVVLAVFEMGCTVHGDETLAE